LDRPPKDASVNALRALGTNAVPYLARQLQRQDSPLALAYAGLYGKFPQVLQKIALKPPSPRRAIRSDAALALSVLGREALPAVPALLQALKTRDPWERSTILQTLRELPFEPTQADPVLDWFCRSNRLSDAMEAVTSLHLRSPGAVRVMISALSSPDVRLRRSVVAELWSIQRAEGVVPALARALKDSDAQVREGAARALERWQPPPSAALPALIEALRTADDELRYLAARTLAEWGTNASPALDALVQATNDTNVIVRNASARGVRRIRGQGD
jgi:HEAT repeat protein